MYGEHSAVRLHDVDRVRIDGVHATVHCTQYASFCAYFNARLLHIRDETYHSTQCTVVPRIVHPDWQRLETGKPVWIRGRPLVAGLALEGATCSLFNVSLLP